MALKYKMKLNAAKIKRQYRAGRKVVEIARLAGFPKNCGQNRVRALLMKAGVYKPKH